MRNHFVLDGKPSTDFNTYIAKSRAFDGVEPDIESVVIPGRNGELTYSNHRYQAFEDEIEAYIPRDMMKSIDGLRAWLSSKTGYVRYEEAIHPNEYRMARFSGAFEVSESDHKGAAITLPFTFQPQRWLKSGEEVITLNGNRNVYNPTQFRSKPLIRAYGTGYFYIGSIKTTITAANEYTDIDCEIMDAFKGATNCNGNVSCDDFSNLGLEPGENNITLSGITKLKITPRWWEI